jgi:hypothetical protein
LATVAIRGRFDGKVFIPDETVDLPRDQRVILHVEPDAEERASGQLPPGMPGSDFRQFIGMISEEDLKLMSDAIEDGCEQIDPGEW